MLSQSLVTFALSLLTFSQIGLAASVKRQTPDSCTEISTGYLAVRPASDFIHGPATYVGIVDGVKHTGIDGASDSIIVTVDDNGNPLAPQVWEFVRCTNDNGHAPPPGYDYQATQLAGYSFGILRPQGATQHCLAVESENDATVGARNSILDSYCNQVPEEYRLWMKADYVYDDGTYGHPLFFANQNTSTIIGNTAHKELQFFTNTTSEDGDKVQLTLLDVQ